CRFWYDIASSCKAECDERQYWRLAVETMLLQIQFISLTARALHDTSETSTIPSLQESAKTILTACDEYLRKYPWCQMYRDAIKRVRGAFTTQVPLYETRW